MASRHDGNGSRVLIVDDDADACELAATVLRGRGYDVLTETDAKRAIDLAVGEQFDAVVTDLHLDALDGLAVCERILAARPGLPVIVMTGHASMDAVVAALRAGAYDFVTKPIAADVLVAAVARATQSSRLHDEVRRLQAAVDPSGGVSSLLGESAAMRRVYDSITRIAATDATALVTGESGTGKELIARALHDRSSRSAGPFVAINCAAVPATLLESELFGHVRGAFTDAKSSRRGLFLDAHGGTLFLDEIGEMPLEMQVKLLRALQERTVRPVGGGTEVAFDARIIAATNRDLEAEVSAGRFRADLYYRINVCTLEVPPLREREGDIALLAQSFTQRFAERHRKQVQGLTGEALGKLLSYSWPGNVRELENCIERAVAMTQSDRLVVDDLPDRLRAYRPESIQSMVPDTIDAIMTMDELEQQYIARVLQLVNGNKSRAARLLGYDRRTLYRKLDRVKAEAAGLSGANGTNGAGKHVHESHDDLPDSESSEVESPTISTAPPTNGEERRRPTLKTPMRGLPGLPRVSLVDADGDGRELLQLLLEGQGFAVQSFATPGEANVGNADVVVVTGAPGGKPPTTLVRPSGPPVVWITGNAQAGAGGGFAQILPKPVRLEELAATLRNLTARARANGSSAAASNGAGAHQ